MSFLVNFGGFFWGDCLFFVIGNIGCFVFRWFLDFYMGDLGSFIIGYVFVFICIVECLFLEGECFVYGFGYWYVESDSN